MKKQVRTLIIITTAVLVLVALLLGLLFLLPGEDDDTTSESSVVSDTSISLVNKSVADDKTVEKPVKKAVIKTGDEEFTIAPNKEEQLVVKGYEDLPIGTSEIESLIGSLARVTAIRKVADDSSKEADFGLNKPKATAVVTFHDDSVVTFELGNDSAGDEGSYLRIKKDGPIYLVDTSFAQQLIKESVMYIGTTLITPPEKKDDDEGGTAVLKTMKLSGSVRAAKPLVLGVNEKNTEGVYSSFPYLITAPKLKGTSDAVSTMAQSVISLSATQAVKAHPTAAQLKKYGLDKPYSIGELTLAVQSTSQSEDEESKTTFYNSTKHRIELGDKDEEGNYYAMVDEYDAVYLVPSASVPWAESQYGDLVTKMLFLRDITGVKSITLEDDKKTTFNLTHFPDEEDNDKSMVVKVGDKTYTTPDFRTLYQVFMMVSRYGETNETPKGKADLVFTLTPTAKSDSTVTARFYKSSASIYTCVLSDGDVYTVKASDIQKLTKEWNNYLNGKEVTTN